MSIKGLSEQRRVPRLGKFHLGIKVEKKNEKGEVVSTYPKAVDYFVVPPKLITLLGEQPRELDIMFPVEDTEKFASQFYKNYSNLHGLRCRGNGETCMRMVDTTSGGFADRATKEATMKECRCEGMDCPEYVAGKCKEIMCLQFLLPNVPGLGVWQLDTSSYHSIVNVNSAIDLIRGMCGRIAMIPLSLTLEPREVTIKGERGQVKKTVNVLQIRTSTTLAEIQRLGATPTSQVMLPPPDEAKPDLLFDESEEVEEAPVPTKSPEEVQKDIDTLWDKKQPPPVVVKAPDKPHAAPVAPQTPPVVEEVKPDDKYGCIDKVYLDEALANPKLKKSWPMAQMMTWLRNRNAGASTIQLGAAKLNQEDAKAFCKEIKDRIDMA